MIFSQSSTKRIAILYPSDYLETVPAVRNTIIMLAQYGYSVEVFIYQTCGVHPPVQFAYSNIIVHELRQRQSKSGISKFIPNIMTFTLWACSLCRGKQYHCFIGVDPHGLGVAALLGVIYRVPWVYFSLELMISTDPIRQYPYFKFIESWASRRSSLIIIQDEIRARMMAEDNDIVLNRFVFLPNSPLGAAGYRKTNIFQQKFGFGRDDRILLHSGSVSNFTMIYSLAEISKNFPDNWKFVIHSRANLKYREGGLDKLTYKNVFLSKDGVPYSLLSELVSSADIGIALYDITKSPNLLYMGKSSGKIIQYLQCGLPVIITNMPWWDEKIKKYHAGVTIDSPDKLIPAAKLLFENYGEFSRGAINLFEHELRFESAFDDFLDKLNSIQ